MPATNLKNAPGCFFYGSLQNPTVLNSVTRPGPDSDLFTVRASIKGHVRYPYATQPYPAMIASPNPTDTVEGLLVFGHSDLERARLDGFEGDEYPRVLLPVTIHDPVPAKYTVDQTGPAYEAETTVDAYVYIYSGPLEHLDMTRPWDYEVFKRDLVHTWVSSSPDFVTMISRTEV